MERRGERICEAGVRCEGAVVVCIGVMDMDSDSTVDGLVGGRIKSKSRLKDLLIL